MTVTTISIASGTDDQQAQKTSTGYPPSGSVIRSSTLTTNASRRSGSGSSYVIYNTLLKFDTSSIPDADTIISALLRVWTTSVSNVDTRNFRGEWYTWDGTSASDYQENGSSGITAFDTALSGITSSASNDFTLTNLNQISATGNTYLRLHITGGQPTGLNEVYIAALEHATLAEPKLIVTHEASVGHSIGRLSI